MIEIDLIRSFKNSILGFDREKLKVKVKALTLTNSMCTVKSKNQKVSEDYENYIWKLDRKWNLLIYNS